MITERQEKLLNFLIKEYITTAEPVSSMALKKITDLDVCSATIRNDLQTLAKEGFIKQPHTSAGRIPTKKAYKYFADKSADEEFTYFIVPACRQAGRQIRFAHQEMEQEMKKMEELMQILEKDNMFDILNLLDKWHRNQFNQFN